MENSIEHLESRIHTLVAGYQTLRQDNQQLQAEKSHLLHQLQDAARYIERVISELKSLETLP